MDKYLRNTISRLARTESQVSNISKHIDSVDIALMQIIEVLKQNNCLSQDFQFKAKAEEEAAFQKVIDDFIKS